MSILKKSTRTLFLCLFSLLSLCVGTAFASEVKMDSAYSHVAVAPGAEVIVNVLVRIQAPIIEVKKVRQPVSISLVIDRSGSMLDAKKFTYAIAAGKTLVNALEPSDQLAIVVYSTDVKVLRPLAPVTDKKIILAQLDALKAEGYTNLSGGLQAGTAQLQSANKKIGSEGIRRVILLSDGLANLGITGGEQVAKLGANASRQGITVSTIGLGLDYDENLMQLLGQRGGGNYYYIKDSEDLPLVFKQELNLTANLATQGLKIVYETIAGPQHSKIYGYNTTPNGANVEVEFGDLTSGEKRQMLLRIPVAPEAGKDTQALGAIRLTFTNRVTGKEETTTLPLQVRVEKDAATAEKSNTAAAESTKIVREEALVLDAEEKQVAAMNALEAGKTEEAKQLLSQSRSALMAAPMPSEARKNKVQQLEAAAANVDSAAGNEMQRKDMLKASKSGYYNSAQGNKQGMMMQNGDTGFMVEKLQASLKKKGFYKDDISGKYDAAVEEAVKAFQKSVSLPVDGIAGQRTLDALSK